MLPLIQLIALAIYLPSVLGTPPGLVSYYFGAKTLQLVSVNHAFVLREMEEPENSDLYSPVTISAAKLSGQLFCKLTITIYRTGRTLIFRSGEYGLGYYPSDEPLYLLGNQYDNEKSFVLTTKGKVTIAKVENGSYFAQPAARYQPDSRLVIHAHYTDHPTEIGNTNTGALESLGVLYQVYFEKHNETGVKTLSIFFWMKTAYVLQDSKIKNSRRLNAPYYAYITWSSEDPSKFGIQMSIGNNKYGYGFNNGGMGFYVNSDSETTFTKPIDQSNDNILIKHPTVYFTHDGRLSIAEQGEPVDLWLRLTIVRPSPN